MTTVLEADGRLAWIAMRGGPAVHWARLPGGHRSTLSGDGLSEWTASDTDLTSKSLSISKHVDGESRRILEISPPRDETSEVPIRWNSTLFVGKGRYVRATGTAGDFWAAHAACESHEHESRQVGAMTWWRESEDAWVS